MMACKVITDGIPRGHDDDVTGFGGRTFPSTVACSTGTACSARRGIAKNEPCMRGARAAAFRNAAPSYTYSSSSSAP